MARLLNPEVDLIFFDTTSTYFVFRDRAARRLVWRDQHERVVDTDIDTNGGDGGALAAGATERAGSAPMGSRRTTATTSQVVVGMAVARDGIPVRVWCWPGNTSDSPLIRQVKDDLRDWTLGNVVWVADRGFTAKGNRRHLPAGADGDILGEKLRSGSPEAAAAMARQGRYQEVATVRGRG